MYANSFHVFYSNFLQLTQPGPICTRCFNNVIQSNSRPSQLWNNPFRKFHQKSRQGAHLRVRENDTVTFRYIIKPLGFSVLVSVILWLSSDFEKYFVWFLIGSLILWFCFMETNKMAPQIIWIMILKCLKKINLLLQNFIFTNK